MLEVMAKHWEELGWNSEDHVVTVTEEVGNYKGLP